MHSSLKNVTSSEKQRSKSAASSRKASPTPVAIKEALDNLHEEIADVLVCCEVLPVDWTMIREIEQKKSDRWTLRLRDQKEVQQE